MNRATENHDGFENTNRRTQMKFTRNLKKGTSGEDVLFCKQRLLELGFYGDHITTVTRKTFGADTLEAVKRFQAQAGLTVDGVIGKETWAALIDGAITEAEPITKPAVADKAKAICALALTRIGDLYVWGASGFLTQKGGQYRRHCLLPGAVPDRPTTHGRRAHDRFTACRAGEGVRQAYRGVSY